MPIYAPVKKDQNQPYFEMKLKYYYLTFEEKFKSYIKIKGPKS